MRKDALLWRNLIRNVRCKLGKFNFEFQSNGADGNATSIESLQIRDLLIGAPGYPLLVPEQTGRTERFWCKKLNFARSLSGEDVWRMSGEEDGTSFRFDYFLLFASLSHCLLVPFTSKVCDWKCRCISINLANCSPPRQNSGHKQRKLTASCPSRVFLLNWTSLTKGANEMLHLT